jgi:hypothetical protein
MEEQFQLDLEIDDSVIDVATRKLQTYERHLKRISALSKRAGSGIRTGGGIGAGSVGSHAGSLGGSQMLTQLASQVGAMKFGQTALGPINKANTNLTATTPRLPTSTTPRLPTSNLSSGFIGFAGAGAGADFAATKAKESRFRFNEFNKEQVERRRARRQQRAARGGTFGTQAKAFGAARMEQFGGQLGAGSLSGKGLAKGAVGGMFRRVGSVAGSLLGTFGGVPGFIVGGILGAAIGGLGDVLFDKLTAGNQAAKEITKSLRDTAFTGEVSKYISDFSTKRLGELRDYNEMVRQAVFKDDVSLFTWWGSRAHDGFWGPGWSNANVRFARKQAEQEFSRRRQGIVDIDDTSMNFNRIEETIKMMVRQ